MHKRLILVLTLAFVVGIAFAAYAEVQNVKVGGDYTAMAFSRVGFNLAKPRTDIQGLAHIANIKFMADLTDAVSVTMIVRNERIWGGATGSMNSANAASTTTYLAVGFVTLKDFIQEGWTFKVGQQAVKIGSGLIMGDPSTNQLASTSAPFHPYIADFDPRVAWTGMVASMDYSPLKLDFIALKESEGELQSNSDDSNVYMLQAGYDLQDVLNFKSVGEAYYFLKDDYKGDTQVFGVRTVMSPAENLDVSAEYAQQSQKNDVERPDDDSMWDWAFTAGATMGIPDVEWSPTIGIDYTRLSANWDPLYETMTPADIANALFGNSNVSCIGATVTAKPMEDLKMKLRYANLRLVDSLDEADSFFVDGSTNTVPATYDMNPSKKRIGDEIDLHLTYDYTADVQFKLMGGYFNPGSAFEESNEKSASQVIGSMKVTF